LQNLAKVSWLYRMTIYRMLKIHSCDVIWYNKNNIICL